MTELEAMKIKEWEDMMKEYEERKKEYARIARIKEKEYLEKSGLLDSETESCYPSLQ
ncbi:hypothetical protein AGMMS49942_02740 [Spirochaetia bacterium]|nr:hypothetical protein AGMMS49942_02740 [Spirochaetia bacterium]